MSVAWFQAVAAVTPTANTVSGLIGTKETSAVNAGVLFTVAKTSTNTAGIELTDNSGKTGYWDTAAGHAVDGLEPSKGYDTYVYSVTASKAAGAGDTTLAELLDQMYEDTTSYPSHKIYLRVTAGSQARVATASADVYKAAGEGATVTVEIALADGGATTSWTGLTVYASVKANTTEEIFASASTLYAGATLSATVGTASADFAAA